MDLLQFISKPEVVWFLIGLAFFLLEFILPGLIVLFFGIGAWVTAIFCLLFDVGINVQLLIFIFTSILSLIFLRKYFKKIFVGKGEDAGDDLWEEFIGKTAVAENNFEKGKRGKIAFKGTTWEAESDEPIKKGDSVKIIGKESIVLKIEPIK